MTVDTTYFAQSSDTDDWDRSVAYINSILLAIDKEKVTAKASSPAEERDVETQRAEALSDARQVLAYTYNQFNNSRRFYTLGHLDTQALLFCTQQRLINNWQDILDTKAAFGTAACIEEISKAAQQAGTNLNMTQALVNAVQQQTLAPGLTFNGNLDTVSPLLERGAIAFYSNYSLYLNTVANGRMDIARVMARQSPLIGNINLDYGMKWAREQGRHHLVANFRELWWEYGRFHVSDPSTLVETKQIQDDSRIKIVFNFAAQRVCEIKEFNVSRTPPQVLVSEFRFDEYGTDAITSAHAKLIELGGKPPEYRPQLERKPSSIRSITSASSRG